MPIENNRQRRLPLAIQTACQYHIASMPTHMVEKRVGDIKLVGFSLAGEETVVGAPELNVCFDVGRAPREIISLDTVCLSHGHMDHAAGLGYYFSQRNFIGNEPGTVLAPTELVAPIRELVRVWGRIEGHPTPANVIGLEPGQDHRLRRDLIVRAFAVEHGAPALGFCVIETRRKLKVEFGDLSGPQLVELKKRGTEIEYDLEVPLVCYPGDTADGAHFDLDFVRQSRVMLLECSFFDPDHVHRARVGKHLHVFDLPHLLERLENPHVVLLHLSRRTALKAARRHLREVVGPGALDRTSFLMERTRSPRHAPADHQAPDQTAS